MFLLVRKFISTLNGCSHLVVCSIGIILISHNGISLSVNLQTEFSMWYLRVIIILCFSSPMKRFMYGHKKGVEIILLFYLVIRSWRTLAVDKTTAPHRKAYTDSLSGVGIATDVGAIVKLSSLLIKPPSLELEDKISITPFRRTKSPPSTKVESGEAVSSANSLGFDGKDSKCF